MAQSVNRTLIIPAAGTASRLRGLPKFLLPTHSNSVTLIERHLNFLRTHFDKILIGINPDFSRNLNSVLSQDHQIKFFEMSTRTMMETVTRLTNKTVNDNFMLIMPDTYFSDYSEIATYLENENPELGALFCWKIEEYQLGKLGQVLIDDKSNIIDIQDKNPLCSYKSFWGAAIFSRKHLHGAVNSDPHIGYLYQRLIKKGEIVKAYKVNGDYYDCGTQKEYIEMLLNTKL